MKYKCRTCGQEFVARDSKNGSAKANMLKNLRKHYKEKHKGTIGRRISNGLRKRNNNSPVLDMVNALRDGLNRAISVGSKTTTEQFNEIDAVMTVLEPSLDSKIVDLWKAVKAVRDAGYFK